jgi:hypothetical protein
VVGFAGISLMSPPVSVYESSTNSSLEVLSWNNFKMDLLVWTYVAGEFVSANTTCMQPTYQCSSGLHPWNLFRWCMPTASHHENNYLILFANSTSLQKRTMQTPHGRVKTIHLHNFKFFYISVIMMITHCCFCYQPWHACWFCFLLPADQPCHWPQNHTVRACTTLFLEGYMTTVAQPW